MPCTYDGIRTREFWYVFLRKEVLADELYRENPVAIASPVREDERRQTRLLLLKASDSRRVRTCRIQHFARGSHSSVEVRLKVNHQAVLTVRDSGRGVPAELIQGSQTNGEHFGVGLSGVRERVNDLGGKCEMQSSGNGTLITVSIPLATQTSTMRVPL